MAFIPVLDGIKVVPQFTLNGKLVVNVLYVTKPVLTIAVDLPLAAEIFRDWWVSNFPSVMPTTMQLNSVVATQMNIEGGAQYTLTDELPVAGTSTSPALPNNVALVGSLRTARIGRSYRGRMYMPGLTEALVTGNVVASSYAADTAAALALLKEAYNAEGFSWVVASFQHNNAPRLTAVTTAIDAIDINTRVDTQRRRLPV